MFKTAFKGFKGIKGLTAAGLFLAPVPSVLYCQSQNKKQSNSHHHHDHGCSHDQDYTRLLDGNKLYIDQKTAQDPEYFKKLAQGQRPKYLLIGCSDSRVPPNELTNTGPGELFIHRNVANLVAPTDFNLNSVLQFSIEVLQVRHIIVMGHTQCGGVKASIDGAYHGMIDQWLVAIREVYQKYNKDLDPIKDSEEKLRRLTELTVKEQVMNLCKNQFVQKAWAAKQPLDVHGWICDIETGKIIDLQENGKQWDEIKPHFTMQYSKEQLVRS